MDTKLNLGPEGDSRTHVHNDSKSGPTYLDITHQIELSYIWKNFQKGLNKATETQFRSLFTKHRAVRIAMCQNTRAHQLRMILPLHSLSSPTVTERYLYNKN